MGRGANPIGDGISRREQRPDGTQVWRDDDGRIHRADGPAVEFPDGSAIYAVDGSVEAVQHGEDAARHLLTAHDLDPAFAAATDIRREAGNAAVEAGVAWGKPVV